MRGCCGLRRTVTELAPDEWVSLGEQIDDGRGILLPHSSSSCGVRRQVPRPRCRLAYQPRERISIRAKLDIEPQCQLRPADADLFAQRFVLEAFVDLDVQGHGWQANLAGPVDIGAFTIAILDIAADVHAEFGGEVGESAERSEVGAVGVTEVDAHRRRLLRGGVVDADVNGVHRLGSGWISGRRSTAHCRTAAGKRLSRSIPCWPAIVPPGILTGMWGKLATCRSLASCQLAPHSGRRVRRYSARKVRPGGRRRRIFCGRC